jgi:hypothetical protein
MARLYANENFPLPVVERLRELGHDVLTIHETGEAGRAMPDDAVLNSACGQRRAVLTFNRSHFIQLHRQRPEHSGIVACTFDADFQGLAQRIHEAVGSVPDLAGQLIRVNRPAR